MRNLRDSTKLNILSNYIGRGVSTVISFIAVPFYIRLLGTDSYGLVGFLASLQAVINLADFGISTSLARELAGLGRSAENSHTVRNTIRTLEIVYWLIVLIMSPLVAYSSSWLGVNWLHSTELKPEELNSSIILICAIIIIKFPCMLYSSGLMGLQKQISQNLLNIFFSITRVFGAIGVLSFISQSVQAFFLWQLFVSIGETGATAVVLWRLSGNGFFTAKFDSSVLKKLGRFAGGVAGISVTSVIFLQLDKFLISKFFPLSFLGFYTIAFSAAGVLSLFSGPIFASIFPRFSELIATKKDNVLKSLFHKSAQLTAIAVWPCALVIIFFSERLLFFWTGNAEVSNNAALPLVFLVLGNAFNSMIVIPYALQLASGWTKLTLYLNSGSSVLLICGDIILLNKIGIVGASIMWCVVGFFQLLIGTKFIFSKLMNSEYRRWGLYDVIFPALASLFAVALAYKIGVLFSITGNPQWIIVSIFAYIFGLILSTVVSKEVRIQIMETLAIFRKK